MQQLPSTALTFLCFIESHLNQFFGDKANEEKESEIV